MGTANNVRVRWARFLVGGLCCLSLFAGCATAAVTTRTHRTPKIFTNITLSSALSGSSSALTQILNKDMRNVAPAKGAMPEEFGGSLILKPDLGSCKMFKEACTEGGIISPVPTHPIRTLGAGFGIRVGGTKFEFARGLDTGTNFIGIKTPLP